MVEKGVDLLTKRTQWEFLHEGKACGVHCRGPPRLRNGEYRDNDKILRNTKRSTFGSTCRVVRTSNDCWNICMQFTTALSITIVGVVTMMVFCSLISNRVEG